MQEHARCLARPLVELLEIGLKLLERRRLTVTEGAQLSQAYQQLTNLLRVDMIRLIDACNLHHAVSLEEPIIKDGHLISDHGRVRQVVLNELEETLPPLLIIVHVLHDQPIAIQDKHFFEEVLVAFLAQVHV